MQFAYVMLEWCRDQRGADVVVQALNAAAGLHVPETVHPLGGFDNRSDGQCESELYFTVGVPDGDDALLDLVDAIRGAGTRVPYATVIPERLARATHREVQAWDAAEMDRLYGELTEPMPA